VLWFRHPSYAGSGKHWLVRELPKNGDVPKSPLLPIGSPAAIGGHNSNLKIDLGM